MTTPPNQWVERTLKYQTGKGERYGRLTAIRAIDHRTWLFLCDCGSEKTTLVRSVVKGVTRSCGCLQKERSGKKVRHGMTQTKVYHAWEAMISRCYRVKNASYLNYGGKGITVCERWRTSFELFFLDVGHPPSAAHTLDRIDSFGNYEPGNCRWATWKEQNNNKREHVRKTA